MTELSELTATIDTYVASFNESDADARAKLVTEVWADAGRHVDPLGDYAGHEAIGMYLAGVQDHYPGHRVERVTGIDAHHDVFRFGWRFVGPDGAVVVTATDVGALAPDGRIQRIESFFGDLPPA